MSKPSREDRVETVYAMHHATAVVIERFDESIWLFEDIDEDLLVTVRDLIADLYYLQVSLGMVADFHGRDVARSRQAGS
jgi:hypothetical protein